MSAPRLPGAALVTLRLGEAPQALPTVRAVRTGAAAAVDRFGAASVDRVLRSTAPGSRVALVHAAASARGFDALEHVTAVARTYRVATERPEQAETLVDALRDVSIVEATSPVYLASTPVTAAVERPVDAEPTWAALDAIGAVEAMAYEPGDPSIVLGLVDTGVLSDHPELPLQMRTGVDTVEIGHGSLSGGLELLGDGVGFDTDPQDEVGHGTACAVLMSGVGGRLPPGLAGACSLLPARALGAAHHHGRVDRIGIGATDDIDDAVKRVIDLGAKVINCSFGTDLSGLDPAAPVPHAAVCRYAISRGCVLVAASGNSGKPDRYTPAVLDGVIAVGAMGTDGRPARFSTRGEHVLLAAPGERLAMAALSGYGAMSGTSFASPLVAATAALLVSRAARRGVSLDAGMVAGLLAATTQPWPDGVAPGNGTGVLDSLAALRALDRSIDRGTEQTTTNTPPEGGTA